MTQQNAIAEKKVLETAWSTNNATFSKKDSNYVEYNGSVGYDNGYRPNNEQNNLEIVDATRQMMVAINKLSVLDIEGFGKIGDFDSLRNALLEARKDENLKEALTTALEAAGLDSSLIDQLFNDADSEQL
jgi:hypothetical protein